MSHRTYSETGPGGSTACCPAGSHRAPVYTFTSGNLSFFFLERRWLLSCFAGQRLFILIQDGQDFFFLSLIIC